MRAKRIKKATSARRTIAYIRVSTEEQATIDVSLDAQEARIVAYAVAIGFDVSDVVQDAGVSTKTLQRPGIGKIIEDVRAGKIERVIILKLDRRPRFCLGNAMRRPRFYSAPRSLGARFFSVDRLAAFSVLAKNEGAGYFVRGTLNECAIRDL